MPKTNIAYWLALKYVPKLAIHKKIALVKQHSLKALFHSPDILQPYNFTGKQLQAFQQPNWAKISQIVEQSAALQSEIIVYDSDLYPTLLKTIYDPPLVLFIKGNAELLNKNQIAMVGSRSATVNGRETATSFAKQLVSTDIVITSGLAIGIDSAAHRGAIEGKGQTIAVIATGIDITYPARHKNLSREILESGGLIVSEFVPGTSPKPGHFPKRNRIISGLSQGVIVVEAEIKSGSLITARCAIEQNREVYAIPGAINNPYAKGCHWLIKQGAKLVEECADIVEELVPSSSQASIKTNKENNCQQDLFNDSLLASVGYEVTPIDIVASRSKLSIEVVLTRLTMLELKGQIRAVPGGFIRLNRG